MALVSKNIPNLINGVSQQPAALRLESQGEVQENGFSDVVDGLKKRPPTKFLKQLKCINGTAQNQTDLDARTDYVNITGLDNAYFHTYKRSDDEQYHIVITSDKIIHVYDIEGNLRYQSGVGSWMPDGTWIQHNNDVTTYLPTSPKDITSTSVADATFIVNKNKQVAEAVSPKRGVLSHNTKSALIYLKSVNYGRKYTLYINGTSTSAAESDYTTPKQVTTIDTTPTNDEHSVNTDDLKTSTVIDNLRNLTVTGSGGITKTPSSHNEEPYFIVAANDAFGDFSIKVTDDDGGVNLKAFKGNAKSFTDLPNQCEDGFVLGVVGDNQKKEDDFYVKFEGTGGSGYWKECVAPNVNNGFNLSTMPHQLRQNGNLSFSFGEGTWDNRVCGDDNTNPFPSFVGSHITDIFFHRNRLGILAGENVIFSEASGYYNFFRTTVRTLLDSDPIDVAVSQNEVSELKAAVPIQDNLLLFSNLNQFTLSATQLLTPAEVTVDQSTKYECDLTASPVGAGNSVFFATKSGDYGGVREFFTRDDTEIKDAVDITSHVPEYIKGNIRHFVASSNEDMLVALTNSDKYECYIYKWYNSSQERLQSSWSKWRFNKPIGSVFFNNAELFFTFTDGSYEKMSLTASSSAITVAETPISSASPIYFSDSFGGTDYDNTYYINPANRESWGGWATTTGSNHQIQIPYGATLSFYAATELSQDQTNLTIVLENAPYPNTNPSYTIPAVTVAGSTLVQYTIDIPPQNPDHVFTNIIMRSSADDVKFRVQNVSITATQGLVRGAEQDVLLDHRKYILGSQTPSQLITWGITPQSQFINHKGQVIGQGNSPDELSKVSTYLSGYHMEINDHNGDGNLTNEPVDNYVYVGEPYTFKYQMSEQVFKPKQGDTTRLARLQLRKISFNFNDTGYFEVDVSSTGRDTKKTTFTGRTLGQIDNLLGYSAVVQDGTQEVGIQSQADQANITITNDTHLPCIFQSAEWEGFVTLRNQRL
jgi:hypothetical protein